MNYGAPGMMRKAIEKYTIALKSLNKDLSSENDEMREESPGNYADGYFRGNLDSLHR